MARLAEPGGPSFALLYRPQTAAPDMIDIIIGDVATPTSLADLRLPPAARAPADPGHDVLLAIPYRQITERGFACRDDGTPILALTVGQQHQAAITDVLRAIPDEPVALADTGFDIDDAGYAELVRTVIADEIGQGAGSNFVIKRSFLAQIEGYSRRRALAMFRRLLSLEQGSYWTFIVHTPARTLVGASPERHATLMDGTATMNPISGTYRYPPDGPSLPGALRFLSDPKEADELYMVVDEELKMMAAVCTGGGRVSGPYLKEMAKLAHSEYVISGPSTMDARDILRRTMFAPTVTGSPIENACRVIARHEPTGRGYYSGALALIGRDSAGRQTLDSAIMIRTADIDPAGRLDLGVGATLVRHSDPMSEAAETSAKATGLLSAITARSASAVAGPHARLAAHPRVRRALVARNRQLARYWLEPPGSLGPPPAFSGYRTLVIDAEDSFTEMLGHQLRSLGLQVVVRRFDQVPTTGHELVVLGPGPGDPTDRTDPKIVTMLDLAGDLVRGGTPFLAVCLGHQILARALGIEVVRKATPNQGVQRVVDLFGRPERVGFYNTFAARTDVDRMRCVGVGVVEISRDRLSGEVHAIRGPHFRSFQFHPESVLTEHGVQIVAAELAALLPGERAAAG
jgi:phenazine biosynthesis protein phzE